MEPVSVHEIVLDLDLGCLSCVGVNASWVLREKFSFFGLSAGMMKAGCYLGLDLEMRVRSRIV